MMRPQGWVFSAGGPTAAEGPSLSTAMASSGVRPRRSSGPWDPLRVTGRSQRQVSARTSLPSHGSHARKAAGMPSSPAAFTPARRRVPSPWSRDAVWSDPLPPGVTLSISQSRKDGSSGVLAITKHVSPSFHPKTTLLLPGGSQQTSWDEYWGSVFPPHGEDGVGNASSPIQPSGQKRFGHTLEHLGICTHFRIQ